MTRRELLSKAGAGFGMVGLSQMLGASKPTHFPAKAKHVIFLFLNGGPSHIDTFDPKPLLMKYNGKALPTAALKTERKTGNVLASPWAAKRYGKNGIEMTELFPKMGELTDDLCIIRSMHTESEPYAGPVSDEYGIVLQRPAIARRMVDLRARHRQREPARILRALSWNSDGRASALEFRVPAWDSSGNIRHP